MNFALVLLCLLSGWALRRGGVLAANSHLGLNAWLIYLAVPAAALLYVPKIHWNLDMLWPILMPVLVWWGAWCVLGRPGLSGDHAPNRGSLLLGAGLGNTSFVGFPLTMAYYGTQGLEIAVVCDQVSFLVLSTLGVATALTCGEGHHRQRGVLAGLVRFPPFIAFIVALCLPKIVGYGELPVLWGALVATLAPVALFSIGIQLEIDRRAVDKALALGLIYKLILAPGIMMGLLWLFGVSGLVAKVTVLEAAMASMATTSVLAVQYGLNTRLNSLMIGLGVPISLLTTYLWWLAIEQLF